MRRTLPLPLGLCLLLLVAASRADEPSDESTPPADSQTYLLRYRFEPGETVRWKVVHRAKVATTVSGTSQTAETTSTSVKVWRILKTDPAAGQFTFEHSVESVDMRQKVTGREEVRYNSLTDEEVPIGFEAAAEAVGVPLTIITMDDCGDVINREERRAQAPDSAGQITIPLPAEPIPVGHAWTYPYDVNLTLRSGQVKTVKTRQRFALTDVSHGVATISVETQILTPIHDPAVEAQLIQRETSGTVRFDLEQGRVLSQQMDLDRRVLGFSGEASSMHYLTRFTEELLPDNSTTANPPEPVAGPAPPPKRSARQSTAAKPAPRNNKAGQQSKPGGSQLRRR